MVEDQVDAGAIAPGKKNCSLIAIFRLEMHYTSGRIMHCLYYSCSLKTSSMQVLLQAKFYVVHKTFSLKLDKH